MIYNKKEINQNKIKKFINDYEKINFEILKKEKDISKMKDDLSILLTSLKELREKETKWNKEQAKKLNITEQEFTKITKEIAMKLNRQN